MNSEWLAYWALCALAGLVLGWLAIALILVSRASGADLPIPPLERCVAPGVQPARGEVMAEDKTCPSGLRWRKPRGS